MPMCLRNISTTIFRLTNRIIRNRAVSKSSIHSHVINNSLVAPQIGDKQFREYYSSPEKPENVSSVVRSIEFFTKKFRRIKREDAIALLDVMKTSTHIRSSEALVAIRSFGAVLIDTMPEERSRMVQDVWSEIIRMKCVLLTTHFNALLEVYIENDYPFCEDEFLKSMEETELKPNRETYQLLLKNHTRKGNTDKAIDIMDKMRKEYPLTADIFELLVLGYGEQGEIEKAKALIDRMQSLKFEPDANIYVSLLCAYAKNGDIDSINNQIQQCQSDGNEILPKHYLKIILHLCVNGHSQHIHGLINGIERCYELHQDIINLILQLTMNGFDDAAIELLTTNSFYYADKSMFLERVKAYFSHLIKTKRTAIDQLNCCEKIAETGLGYQAYLTLVRQTAIHGNSDDVLQILRELNKRNVQLTQGFFEPLFPVDEAKAIDLLEILQNEFHFSVNAQFMRDNVMAAFKLNDAAKTVHRLNNVYVSLATSTISVAYECLRRKRLIDAAEVTTNCKIFLQPLLLAFPLIDSLVATRDFDGFTMFVKNIQTNYDVQDRDQASGLLRIRSGAVSHSQSASSKPPVHEAIGKILYDAVSKFPTKERNDVTKRITSNCLLLNVHISKPYADRLRNLLRETASAPVDLLLDLITIGFRNLSPNHRDPNVIDNSDKNLLFIAKEIDNALKSRNIRTIQHVYSKYRNEKLTQRMYISLLIAFKNINSLSEIRDITMKLLETSEVFIIPDLMSLLNKFAKAGDIRTIEEIGMHLSAQQKFGVLYNVALAIAYYESGKTAQLIVAISRQLNEAKNAEDIYYLSKAFPYSNMRDALNRCDFLTTKYEKLAKEFANHNALMPYNVLFLHYFLNGNIVESQRIWNDYLQSDHGFYFTPILGIASNKRDPNLLIELIKLLKSAEIHRGNLVAVYTRLLAIYMDKRMLDKALKTLEDAQNYCRIGSLHHDTVKRIRSATLAAGKKFPFDKFFPNQVLDK